jgi:hypothetical protein
LENGKPQYKQTEPAATPHVDGNTTKTFKFASDGTLKKTKFKCKPCGKFFLHHKSHLNDPTLQPRKLEASENIFEIIMPWLPE